MTTERLDEPFDQLRLADSAISPSSRFTTALRARVVASLDAAALPVIHIPPLERSPIMTTHLTTDLSTRDRATRDASDVAASRPGIVAYICASPAADAIAWYVTALGAVEIERYVGDDGRIGHAQVSINGADMYLADEHPEVGILSPVTLGGSPVSLHLSVADVDAVYAAAVAAGATGERPPADQPYGDRASTIIDPFGHRWMINTTVAHPSVDEIDAAMPGYAVVRTASDAPDAPEAPSASAPPVELGYLTMSAPDTAQATRFFGTLFGWTSETGNMGGDYAHVNNTRLPLGFTPGDVTDGPDLYFRVDDVASYATRVRELGGQVMSEETYESGSSAECHDDQGRPFRLWQPAPGY